MPDTRFSEHEYRVRSLDSGFRRNDGHQTAPNAIALLDCPIVLFRSKKVLKNGDGGPAGAV